MNPSARLRGPRIVGVLSILAVAAAMSSAAAQKKVLIVRSGNFPPYQAAVDGFVEELNSHQIPFVTEDLILPKEEADIGAFLRDVRARRPDLVLTLGTSAARAIKEGGEGLPFVYGMIVDPPSIGIVTGGATMEVRPSEQLDFIRANFPSFKKVGVIHSTARNREVVRLLQEEKPPDIELKMITADTPEEMNKAIGTLSKEADCLLMVSDSLLYSPQIATQIILDTLRCNLPIIAVSPSFVKAGALAAVYPDFKGNGIVAADVAIRFFAGESLSSIPIQWAGRTRTSVNQIIAQRLRIAIKAKTLQEADEVVR